MREAFLKGCRYLDDHPSLRERAERESSPIKDLGGGGSSGQRGFVMTGSMRMSEENKFGLCNAARALCAFNNQWQWVI